MHFLSHAPVFQPWFHSDEVKLFASHQSLFTSHYLLVTSDLLLVTSRQLLVISYQLIVASYQLLVTSYQLLVASYQSLVTGCQSLLAKWLSVPLQTKWLWVRIPLLSLKFQIWRLLRARSSLTSGKLQGVDSL